MPISIAAPNTDIEVISQACTLCGKGGINSLSTNNPFLNDAVALYGSLVSAALSSVMWKFSEVMQPMGTLTTLSPDFEGWLYYWDFPADLIMLHRIDPFVNYTVFGNRVLTMTNQSLKAIYSKNVPVSDWPPAFSRYITFALAYELSLSTASSAGLAAAMAERRDYYLSQASFSVSQNSPSPTLRYVPWVGARYRFRTKNGQFS